MLMHMVAVAIQVGINRYIVGCKFLIIASFVITLI